MVFNGGVCMELAFIKWLLATYGMSIDEYETLDSDEQINIRLEFDSLLDAF